MPKITSGAELVRRLRESGTGEDKLAVCRKVLASAPDPRRVTSADVVAAIEAAFPHSLTVEKAKALAETGEWAGPKSDQAVPIEEQVLAAAKAEPKAK